MSLANELHAQHIQRLHRLGAIPPKRTAKPEPTPPPPAEPAPPAKRDWLRIRDTSAPLKIADIVAAASDHFNLQPRNFEHAYAPRAVTYARQCAIYLSREYTGTSLKEIGRRFGTIDHTTTRYSVEKIRRLLETDGTTRQDIAALKARLAL